MKNKFIKHYFFNAEETALNNTENGGDQKPFSSSNFSTSCENLDFSSTTFGTFMTINNGRQSEKEFYLFLNLKIVN